MIEVTDPKQDRMMAGNQINRKIPRLPKPGPPFEPKNATRMAHRNNNCDIKIIIEAELEIIFSYSFLKLQYIKSVPENRLSNNHNNWYKDSDSKKVNNPKKKSST